MIDLDALEHAVRKPLGPDGYWIDSPKPNRSSGYYLPREDFLALIAELRAARKVVEAGRRIAIVTFLDGSLTSAGRDFKEALAEYEAPGSD